MVELVLIVVPTLYIVMVIRELKWRQGNIEEKDE